MKKQGVVRISKDRHCKDAHNVSQCSQFVDKHLSSLFFAIIHSFVAASGYVVISRDCVVVVENIFEDEAIESAALIRRFVFAANH